MPEKKPRYRVSYKPRFGMWTIHKHFPSIGFRKEAETKFLITRHNKYIEQMDKPPLIEAEAVMGFGSEKDAEHWLVAYTGLSMETRNEIEIVNNIYVHKGGGSPGYTDINICTPEGEVFNVVPIEYKT